MENDPRKACAGTDVNDSTTFGNSAVIEEGQAVCKVLDSDALGVGDRGQIDFLIPLDEQLIVWSAVRLTA